MGSKMQFILNYLEELNRNFRTRIIVNGSCIKIEDLTVNHFLRTAYIADAIKKFTPINTSTIAFQPFIIHSEALDDVLSQSFGCPSSEMSSND